MTVNLENGNSLEVTAHDNSDKNIYVRKVVFNGVEVEGTKISHKLLAKGGRLEFFMSDKAN